MFDFLVTLSLFNLTVLLLPFLVVSYFGLKTFHSIWISVISLLHPDVEFVNYSTVRILLDTHRNQGIISVLLGVKGKDNSEAIKRHLQELVKRRDKSGNLAFPRLQQSLTTRYGTYGWQRRKFDLDQHVSVAKFTYKGRAITDFNIQAYVSDIVAKYLPTEISPWQVVIIPTSDDNHYILFKIHHILLSEGVNVGDLLPLIPPTRVSTGQIPSKSPIVDVLKKPVALTNLKDKLADEISNFWNEFINAYEPLERPELLKEVPTVSQFLAITVITVISIIRECRRGFRVIKPDIFSKLRYFLLTLNSEMGKRHVSLRNFYKSVMRSLSLSNVCKVAFNAFWFIMVSIPIRLPIILYSESLAFYSCLRLNYCPYPHTLIGILYYYIPLVYKSLLELLEMIKIIFLAPRTVVQDILLQEESLQTITLCGRKAVAWSDPVKTEVIKRTARKLGISDTEVSLSACAMGISKYFAQINDSVPNDVPVTMRNINSQYLFATGPNIKPADSVSGIICLNLPIIDLKSDKSQLDNLKELETRFRTSIENQGLSHLLTLLQTKFGILTKFLPSFLLSVYLKFLSRKYAVTLTEVSNRYPNMSQRTLWGQEVFTVVYWRPPQANTSISLCINEYADHVRLGVMCDAQLVPHHPVLARGYPEFVKDLAKAVSSPL
ncbi:uncharacterized protein LOC126737520 [Anthonomus grandis grandis]|uniref:uncharacterized protein LOC126737520 n=1 Tax=Anthonomus grandis grandis TaxID=2921223 RepID=UPI002164F392|nr:uncharacterized protein LOC126737520 [Anthonomus grandis grandis]